MAEGTISAFVFHLSLFRCFMTALLDLKFLSLFFGRVGFFLGNPVSLCCAKNQMSISFPYRFSVAFLGSNLQRLGVEFFIPLLLLCCSGH